MAVREEVEFVQESEYRCKRKMVWEDDMINKRKTRIGEHLSC